MMKIFGAVSLLKCFILVSSNLLESNFFFKVAPPETVTVPAGASLELDCQAGGPSPVIHWLYNNEPIPQVRGNTHLN